MDGDGDPLPEVSVFADILIGDSGSAVRAEGTRFRAVTSSAPGATMRTRIVSYATALAAVAAVLSACGSSQASSSTVPSSPVSTAGSQHLAANTYHVTSTWASVGPTPHFPGADPQLHKLFVSNLAAGTVTVIDTKTGKVSGTITLGGTVHTVMVDTETQRVYVTDIARGYLDVINANNDSVIKEIPVGAHLHGLAVSNRLHEAFVTDIAQNKLYAVDTTTNAVVNPGGLPVGANPWGVAVNAATRTAYVANTGITPTMTTNPAGDTVSVVDLSTMTVSKTVTVGPHPWNVAVDDQTGFVYVGVAGSGKVAVIHDNVVVKDIVVGSSPHGVALDQQAGILFVNNSVSNNVSIIDTGTGTVATTVTVGPQPQGVAVDTSGTAYVVNQKSQTISVLQPGTG